MEQEQELVSVVIPVYKSEEYIHECIESLVHQTYSNLQIIFVLDGITDNSKAIIEKYKKNDSRIVILEKENTGAIDSRKQGLKIASGEYVFFVDSDDWIKLETIEEMLKIAREYNADVVKAGIIKKQTDNEIIMKITDNDITYLEKKDFRETIYKEVLTSYKHNSMVVQLIKTEKIDIESIKNELVLGEDLSFNIDLYGNIENMVLLSKCYYYYRFNQGSVTNKLDIITLNRHMDDIFKLTRKEIDKIQEWNITSSETIKEIYLYMLYRITLYAFNIFSVKSINKENIKIFLTNIIKNPLLNEIKANVLLKDIKKSKKIKRKIFMILVYKGNVSVIYNLGGRIYKLINILKKYSR